MSHTLLFSDVHLKAAEHDRPRHAEFIAFLRQFPADQYRRVICLGDLFDFWFEYKHVIFSAYFDVLRAFADLRDAGVELHLVCGNHDFWAGRFLHDTLGFHIHPDKVTLPFGERRVQFVHGDGINKTDYGYRVYKPIARNRFVVGAFRMLHPDWAMGLAQGVSHGSRTMFTPKNPYDSPETRALRAYAKETLGRGDADVVCCGHAHAPLIEHYPTPTGDGLYINTGDWLQRRSHVTWDGSDFHLHVGNPHPSQVK